METVFWALAGAVFLIIAGYGIVIIAVASLLPPRAVPAVEPLDAVLLVAAHNEEDHIGRKIEDALSHDVSPHRLRVCVVSDGSTDGTTTIVRNYSDPRVSLIEIPEHVGKVAALNRAQAQLECDVVIFSDANSRLSPGALRMLLGHFGDPQVGGVCGAPAIDVRRGGWLGHAESLYWYYDNALKAAESRLGGAVSAQGSLYAIRRNLIAAIPLSVADDFYISSQVPAAGKRLVFEPAAMSIEEVSRNTKAEFGRRVRSSERGWRGLLQMRRLLNPARHGLYSVQLLFHKVLRRMVPLLLLLLLPASVSIAATHWIYGLALGGQILFYGLAAAVPYFPRLRRLPGAAFPFFFVEAQLAMACGLVRVMARRHSYRWKPARDRAV